MGVAPIVLMYQIMANVSVCFLIDNVANGQYSALILAIAIIFYARVTLGNDGLH